MVSRLCCRPRPEVVLQRAKRHDKLLDLKTTLLNHRQMDCPRQTSTHCRHWDMVFGELTTTVGFDFANQLDGVDVTYMKHLKQRSRRVLVVGLGCPHLLTRTLFFFYSLPRTETGTIEWLVLTVVLLG